MTDLLDICFDETCLEGLEGITTDTLWTRLLTRRDPVLDIGLDDDYKAYLWGQFATHQELEFYELPKPREKYIHWERFSPDKRGEKLFDVEYPNLFGINVINDEEAGVRGSCMDYNERINVTSLVRCEQNHTLLMTLPEVEERWGQKFVMVASQQCRNNVLFGQCSNSNPNLMPKIYCVLERIGRGRYNGELTFGKSSLSVFKENSKTIFYFKKILLSQGLICQKKLTIRSNVSQAVLVIRLPRFLTPIISESEVSNERLSNALLKRANLRECSAVLRQELDIEQKAFKKLYQNSPEHYRASMMSHLEFDPSVDQSVYMTKKKQVKKPLHVITLLKPYLYKDEDDSKEEDADDDEEDDTATSDSCLQWQVYERNLMFNLYNLFLRNEAEGLTQIQAARFTGYSKNIVRMFMKLLKKKNLLQQFSEDDGRQRRNIFITARGLAMNRSHCMLLDEHDAMLVTSRNATPPRKAAEPSNQTVLLDSSYEESDTQTPETQAVVNEEKAKCTSAGKKELKKTDSLLNIKSTYRKMRRMKYVMDMLQACSFLEGHIVLTNKLRDAELKEGCKEICDRKSVTRILKTLEENNQIKVFKTIIVTNSGEEKQMSFICLPHLDVNSDIIQMAIESQKVRYNALCKQPNLVSLEIVDKKSLAPSIALVHKDCKASSKIEPGATPDPMENYNRNVCVKYGIERKLRKYQYLHEFCHYMVYFYGANLDSPLPGLGSLEADGEPPTMGATAEESSADILKLSKNVADRNAYPGEPEVYFETNNWNRYLPKMPYYSEYGPGWLLLTDILINLPISWLCKIHMIGYEIPELHEVLDHPLKRYTPLGLCSDNLRRILLKKRKIILSIHDLFLRLAEMGLVTLDRSRVNDKAQTFVYLHKHATLINTASPNCNSVAECPERKFEFNSFQTVKYYWFSLEWICLNTPFQLMVPMDPSSRKRSKNLGEVADGVAPKDIADVGFLPGDRLGAGGLDSSIRGERTQNWVSVKSHGLKVVCTTPASTVIPRKRTKKVSDNKDKDSAKVPVPPKKRKVSESVYKLKGKPKGRKRAKPSLPKVPVVIAPAKPSSSVTSAKKIVRQSIRSNVKNPYPSASRKLPLAKRGDVLDQQLRAKLGNRRCKWKREEDDMLVCIQVTSATMVHCGYRAPLNQVLRDVYHEAMPHATRKLTTALSRRMLYLRSKNRITAVRVELFEWELKQDKDLMKKFLLPPSMKKETSDEDFKQKLREMLKIVYKKYQCIGTMPLEQTFPQTSEEFLEKFTLTKYNAPVPVHCEPKNAQEIQYHVLQNIIHSAMLLSDKTGRAQELYRLFNQYPNKLLEEVFNFMNVCRVITRLKPYQVQKLTTLSTMSLGHYQLAQRYGYAWSHQLPVDYFKNSYKSLQHLSSATEPLPQKEFNYAGCLATVVALMGHERIKFSMKLPDHILQVDLSEEDAKRIQRQLKSEDIDNVSEGSDTHVAFPVQADKTGVSAHVTYNMSAGDSGNTVSRVVLHMIRSTQGTMTTETNLPMVPGRYTVIVNSIKTSVSLLPKKEAVSTYEHDDERTRYNHNNLLIDSKTCRLLMKEQRRLQPVNVSIEPVLNVILERLGPSTMKLAHTIYQHVEETELRGLAHDELVKTYSQENGFKECFQRLLDHRLLLTVGVTGHRYVSHKHCYDWLTHSVKKLKGRGVWEGNRHANQFPSRDCEKDVDKDAEECMDILAADEGVMEINLSEIKDGSVAGLSQKIPTKIENISNKSRDGDTVNKITETGLDKALGEIYSKPEDAVQNNGLDCLIRLNYTETFVTNSPKPKKIPDRDTNSDTVNQPTVSNVASTDASSNSSTVVPDTVVQPSSTKPQLANTDCVKKNKGSPAKSCDVNITNKSIVSKDRSMDYRNKGLSPFQTSQAGAPTNVLTEGELSTENHQMNYQTSQVDAAANVLTKDEVCSDGHQMENQTSNTDAPDNVPTKDVLSMEIQTSQADAGAFTIDEGITKERQVDFERAPSEVAKQNDMLDSEIEMSSKLVDVDKLLEETLADISNTENDDIYDNLTPSNKGYNYSKEKCVRKQSLEQSPVTWHTPLFTSQLEKQNEDTTASTTTKSSSHESSPVLSTPPTISQDTTMVEQLFDDTIISTKTAREQDIVKPVDNNEDDSISDDDGEIFAFSDHDSVHEDMDVSISPIPPVVTVLSSETLHVEEAPVMTSLKDVTPPAHSDIVTSTEEASVITSQSSDVRSVLSIIQEDGINRDDLSNLNTQLLHRHSPDLHKDVCDPVRKRFKSSQQLQSYDQSELSSYRDETPTKDTVLQPVNSQKTLEELSSIRVKRRLKTLDSPMSLVKKYPDAKQLSEAVLITNSEGINTCPSKSQKVHFEDTLTSDPLLGASSREGDDAAAANTLPLNLTTKPSKKKKPVRIMLPPGYSLDMLRNMPMKVSVLSKKVAEKKVLSFADIKKEKQESLPEDNSWNQNIVPAYRQTFNQAVEHTRTISTSEYLAMPHNQPQGMNSPIMGSPAVMQHQSSLYPSTADSTPYVGIQQQRPLMPAQGHMTSLQHPATPMHLPTIPVQHPSTQFQSPSAPMQVSSVAGMGSHLSDDQQSFTYQNPSTAARYLLTPLPTSPPSSSMPMYNEKHSLNHGPPKKIVKNLNQSQSFTLPVQQPMISEIPPVMPVRHHVFQRPQSEIQPQEIIPQTAMRPREMTPQPSRVLVLQHPKSSTEVTRDSPTHRHMASLQSAAMQRTQRAQHGHKLDLHTGSNIHLPVAEIQSRVFQIQKPPTKIQRPISMTHLVNSSASTLRNTTTRAEKVSTQYLGSSSVGGFVGHKVEGPRYQLQSPHQHSQQMPTNYAAIPHPSQTGAHVTQPSKAKYPDHEAASATQGMEDAQPESSKTSRSSKQKLVVSRKAGWDDSFKVDDTMMEELEKERIMQVDGAGDEEQSAKATTSKSSVEGNISGDAHKILSKQTSSVGDVEMDKTTSGEQTSLVGDVTTGDVEMDKAPSGELEPDRCDGPTPRRRSKRKIPEPITESAERYQSIQFLCRPWKTPEGTINRAVMKFMLEGILQTIMMSPGIGFNELKQKYEKCMQPVCVLELVEILEALGCVEVISIQPSHSPSLFSTPCKLTSASAPYYEENSFYLPTLDCILKMGQFVDQLAPGNYHILTLGR